MMNLAAFDFDGTLTYRDSLLFFLECTFGKTTTYLKFLRLLPKLARFPLGLISRQGIKEEILTAFLKDLPLDTLNQMGEDFASGPLRSLIKPDSWQKLKWHQSQGHTTVLISANLSFYLAPFVRNSQIDVLLCSELEINQAQKVTGKLKGQNCRGEEKVRRLTEVFGPKSNYTLYAYGDSAGDKELLQLADYPCYVSRFSQKK